jgi:hypothetical protein
MGFSIDTSRDCRSGDTYYGWSMCECEMVQDVSSAKVPRRGIVVQGSFA